MTMPDAMRAALRRLRRWLADDALPLWAGVGRDPAGGYHDRLGLDGAPVAAPKRVRVQARQAFVYATAAERGWMDPTAADAACRWGLKALVALRRPDGLYGEAAALDGMGRLYDQAFALLAFAAGHGRFGEYEREAEALRRALEPFVHSLGGFAEAPGLAEPLFANPNMHLLESFMAWRAVSLDPGWSRSADAIATLALERLSREGSVVFEDYLADWRARPDPAARVVWPGHLYEWAFLLLRHDADDPAHRRAALRLIEAAEARGVDRERGVALFALDGTLAPVDRGARLWAQTERLRAVAHAAALTADRGLWDAALEAAVALETFLATPLPGLWRDWMDEGGAFREEPAPASSFYHVVGAIAELERLAGET